MVKRVLLALAVLGVIGGAVAVSSGSATACPYQTDHSS